MLDAYKKKKGTWAEYATQFLALIAKRNIARRLQRDSFAEPTVLLCSEPTAEKCHRRLALEYLAKKWGDVTITHL